MFTIEKNVVIDAPLEQAFAYVVDPEHTPEYYTDVNEVQNLRRLPNGGYACRFMPLDLTVETSEIVPNARIVAHGTACGPLDHVTLTTTFDRLDGDRTRVTCHEEHRFHGTFFGRFGEKSSAMHFDHAADLTMAALRSRIEAKARTTTHHP